MAASGTDEVISPRSGGEGDDDYWAQCEGRALAKPAEAGAWAKVDSCGSQEVKQRGARKQIVAAVDSEEEAEPIMA